MADEAAGPMAWAEFRERVKAALQHRREVAQRMAQETPFTMLECEAELIRCGDDEARARARLNIRVQMGDR